MDNEKNMEMEEESQETETELNVDSAPRARNRTVMLTPEITGQVRARLAQEIDQHAAPQIGEPMGPMAGPDEANTGGFAPVSQRQFSLEPPPELKPRYAASVAGGSFGSARESSMGALLGGAAESSHGQGYLAPSSSHVRQVAGKEGVVWSKITPVIGFMVSFDKEANGEVFVLRSGRLIVTSQEPPGGSYLFLRDESISPMHAIIRITGGDIQVLDQLSEFGTAVKRFGSEEETQLSGDKCSLEHGDVVRFGQRSFQVCILARIKSDA